MTLGLRCDHYMSSFQLAYDDINALIYHQSNKARYTRRPYSRVERLVTDNDKCFPFSLRALYASEAQKITNTSVDHAHYEYAIQIFPDVKVFCKFDFHILLPWPFSSFPLKFNTRCFLG